MKKMRGLVISWYYPPGNSSEGLVTYKLLKNSRFEYDVFTRKSHDMPVWDRQTDETQLTSDNVQVFQSKSNNEKTWINEAAEFFRQNADRYDFVMTRIMPAAAHLVGAKIKEEFPKVFWVASFGDPLVNSPYLPDSKKEDNPFLLHRYFLREHPSLPKIFKLLISPTRFAHKRIWEKNRLRDTEWAKDYERINRLTFAKADKLIFNNKQQFDRAFIDHYEQYRDKGVIISHSYDLDLYPVETKQSEENKKVRFAYVGHLDAMRNARVLFEAISKLKERDQNLSKKVQFDFYGHIDDSDKISLVDHKIYDLVGLHDNVNYLTSLRIMSEADWLILIDTNLNSCLDEYIYLPAKLMDYFGAKKNILAITQLRGASADAMRAVQAGQIVTHSADDIVLYLSKIIYQDYRPAQYDKENWQKYNAKNVANKFDEIITTELKKEN